MTRSSEKLWSDGPNAPQILYSQYSNEKSKFAGNLASAIFYGVVVVLFFQCMGALLNPVDRTRGFKWPFVVHTVAMFSFVTIHNAVNLNIDSTSYVDNRGFPGNEELPPGPLGYLFLSYSKTINIIPTLMFLFNNWLADGILLYRCYVIYAMNYWAIAFPCLLYLGSFAMGILLVWYQVSKPDCTIWGDDTINVGTSYSISVSLNVLLTLMIVVRLILFKRDVRNAMSTPVKVGGLYNTVITMLVESSALYAVSFLLFIATWAAKNSVTYVFFPILAQAQVIAPFMIILRVANRRALTSDIVSGDIGSIHLSRRKATGSSITFADGHTTDWTDSRTETREEHDAGVVATIDFGRDRV